MTNQEIVNLMRNRYSCKSFSDKKISQADFDAILEVVRLSETSFGSEPFKVVVVQNQEIRTKMKEVSWGGQAQIPECSHLLVFLAKNQEYSKYDSLHLKDHFKNTIGLNDVALNQRLSKYKEFQLEDFDLKTDRQITDWAHRQTYIVLANVILMAKAIGIDSCPMEGFDKQKMTQILKDAGVELQGLDVSVMLALGYSSGKVPAREKIRRSIDKIVSYLN